jgi:translation elongation factor EF-1alpha
LVWEQIHSYSFSHTYELFFSNPITRQISGHVDAGKSTLMGQVLVATGQVTKREAAKQGNLSWLLDENEAERERGVTMEIGTKTLRVPNHDIVILDAPGHHDFIPVYVKRILLCGIFYFVK